MSKKAKKSEHITRITATHHASENEKLEGKNQKLEGKISEEKTKTEKTEVKSAKTSPEGEGKISKLEGKNEKLGGKKKLSKAEKKELKAKKKAAKKAGEKQPEKPIKEYFVLARPFVALGRYFRDSWAELRQVRWPNRKATWKMTLAVLIYCAAMMVFVLLLDMLFSFLMGLVVGN